MKNIKNYVEFINEGFLNNKKNYTEGYHVENIDKKDIKKLLKLKYDFFAKSYNNNRKKHDEYSLKNTDWNISKKLMFNNLIIGGYFLHYSTLEEQFLDTENEELDKRVSIVELNDDKWINENLLYDIRPLYNLKGVEGISLFIDKKFQKLGLGQMLIDGVMNDPNIDYMFGYAFHTLNNIDSWMKRRYLIYDKLNFDEEENHDYGYYMTVETKGVKLKMTELGKKYKLEHPNINFNTMKI